MRCRDCHRFDQENETCRDGKLNPQTMPEAIEVSQQFGPRAICMMNDFREQILDVWKGNTLPGAPPRRPHTPLRCWKLED